MSQGPPHPLTMHPDILPRTKPMARTRRGELSGRGDEEAEFIVSRKQKKMVDAVTWEQVQSAASADSKCRGLVQERVLEAEEMDGRRIEAFFRGEGGVVLN